MPGTKSSKPYLTPTEVAALLMVSPVTVRQWARKGLLAAELTPGGHRRFMRREVERFARERGLSLQPPEDGVLRVLVLESEPAAARYLCDLLASHPEPCEAAIARDAFEAGLLVARIRPQVLLMDVNFPGMRLSRVCRQLRDEPSTRGVRVVALVGPVERGGSRMFLDAGADICLVRPAGAAALWRAVGLPSPAPTAVACS